MNKTCKRIFPILVLLLFLSSCEKEINEHELALCGSYSVPGMFCYDLKGGSYSCNILEQDAYGRIMYEYSTTSVISNERETAVIICQKIDSDFVYYYEDICFDGSENAQQDTSALKAANDWNLPLENSKMSRRKNSISFDLTIETESVLDYQSVRSTVCEVLDIEHNQINELCIVDEDYSGNELYFLRVSQNQCYFLLTNSNYESALLKIDSVQSAYSSIAAFKWDNSWTYGNDLE